MIWKCCASWAQFRSAGFSRARHAGNVPASRKLGAIWNCSSRVGHSLKVLRGLGTIWKRSLLAGCAQFRRAHFSRAGHNLEVLRKLGTVWKCSSRVGLNLEMLRGFGTIWNCRAPGRLTLREARTSKLYPTRELHFQIVPNAGEAGTSKLSGVCRG